MINSKLIKTFSLAMLTGLVLLTHGCSSDTANSRSDSATNINTNDNQSTQSQAPAKSGKLDEISDEYLASLSKNQLYVECSKDDGCSFDLTTFYSWQGKTYIFLPGYSDTSMLRLYETYEEDIMIDNCPVVNGEIFALATGIHTLTVGGTSSNFTVMQSANIPAIFISANQPITAINSNKSNETDGEIAFVDTQAIATTVDLTAMHSRGNTSFRAGNMFDKYPYNIKLSKATNVFGLATNKKWCLMANVFDESLIRNQLMNDLSELEGLEFTPKSMNVDVYYNNSYIGNYQLSQRVDIGRNSLINIRDLEKENEKLNPGVDLDTTARFCVNGQLNGTSKNSYKYCEITNEPADISGGYLIEFELNERYAEERCGFVTAKGQPVVIKSPKNCSKAEVEFIRDYVNRVEEAVYSEAGTNSLGEHYSNLIDVDSFAKVYLINEISMNLDATATSFFMYLDNGKLLTAGPVWDFDWSMGSYANRDGINLTSGTGFYVRNKRIYGHSSYDIIATLCSHEDFGKRVRNLWDTQTSVNLKKVLASIDDYAVQNKASADMNYTRHDTLSKRPEWGSANTGTTYEQNIEYLKNFLEKRYEFLNENL